MEFPFDTQGTKIFVRLIIRSCHIEEVSKSISEKDSELVNYQETRIWSDLIQSIIGSNLSCNFFQEYLTS